MAEQKTRPTGQDVESFLNQVPDETKRKDAFVILDMMKQVTGLEPKMWGPSMVGFGSYHYKYESGHEGDAFRIGFSPRKQNLTLYVLTESERTDTLLSQLGKHKTGKSCLYINKLDDVNLDVLKQLVIESFDHMKKSYPE